MPKLADSRKVVWEEMMKESIYEATVVVLTKYGLEGLRMDRVASAAGLATGTLYNYFQNKEELLSHAVLKLFEPLHQKLLEIRDKSISASEKLIEYFHAVVSVYVKNKSLLTILSNQIKGLSVKTKSGKSLDQEIDQSIIKIIAEIIQEGIDQAVFRPCEALKTATLIHWAIKGLIRSKIAANERSNSVKEDVAACTTLLLKGILNPQSDQIDPGSS